MNVHRSNFPRQGSVRTTATPRLRTARSIRPGLEALEGRQVLNASPLDPTFGTGGIALLAPADNTPTMSRTSEILALAEQKDGKIVAAEIRRSTTAGTTALTLVVERFSPTGGLDATFGTNGTTVMPLPAAIKATLYEIYPRSQRILVGRDESIVLGFGTFSTDQRGFPFAQSFVVRLTAAGQFDTSFGTDGVVTLPAALASLDDLALQGDDKVVAVGSQTTSSSQGTFTRFAAARLTTRGTLDPTFHATGQLSFSPVADPDTVMGNHRQGVAIGPGGQIYVATNVTVWAANVSLSGPGTSLTGLTRLTVDGTIDASYGAGGTRTLALSQITPPVVQADGKVVLAGSAVDSFSQPVLLRVNADGTDDATFHPIAGKYTSGILSRIFSLFTAMAIAADGTITATNSVFVIRLRPDGTPDRSFGRNGLVNLERTPPGMSGRWYPHINSLAITTTGSILVGGTTSQDRKNLLARLKPTPQREVANDYDGDGKSDIAAYLPDLAIYAYRPSGGGNDVLVNFGQTGAGSSIPAPANYDSDGITDRAVYLPALGQVGIRPTLFGSDTISPVGSTPNAIAAPGDYDGDGLADRAVYQPADGTFTILRTAGGPVTGAFGIAGSGQTIPAPGDYDGDGVTDIAAYLPKLGAFAYRPSGGGADRIIPFGQVGAGASIPAPGDYDGDGKTDLSVYLPSLGIYAYRPSSGGTDVLQSFGQVGAGASIPAPGDYDGDGKDDLTVYIPALAQFIYRPSSGSTDVVAVFGQAGAGRTIPAGSIPSAQGAATAGGTNARGAVAPAEAAVYIPLTEDPASPARIASTARGPSLARRGATASRASANSSAFRSPFPERRVPEMFSGISLTEAAIASRDSLS